MEFGIDKKELTPTLFTISIIVRAAFRNIYIYIIWVC